MSYLIGASPLPAMGALLWLVAVGLACGLWALGRELGLRYTAALLPLLALVLVDNELHRDLDVYTAENTGRMAAVCALMLGVRALRRRSGWAEPVASGVLFAVAAGSHGIPAFVLMLGLGCYAAALLLVVCERRAVVLRGLAVVGVTVLIWGASLGLSGGDVGFQGAGGSNRYSSFAPNVDPTASLFTGHVVDRRDRRRPLVHRALQPHPRPGGKRDHPPRLRPGAVGRAAACDRDRAGDAVPLPRRAAPAGRVRGAAGGRVAGDRAAVLLPLRHLHPRHVRPAPAVRLPIPARAAAGARLPGAGGGAAVAPACRPPGHRLRGGGAGHRGHRRVRRRTRHGTAGNRTVSVPSTSPAGSTPTCPAALACWSTG